MTRLQAYNTLGPAIKDFREILKLAGPTVPAAADVALTTLRLCAEAETKADEAPEPRRSALRRLAAALAELR